MMKYTKAILAVGVTLVLTTQSALADMTMGIFPRHAPGETVNAFTPLQEHLASAVGEKVELRVFKDFDAFEKALGNRELDIVHLNQMHYIVHKAAGYRVIARNIEGGSDTIVGSLVVRQDSPYKSITDLKGKKILFGGNAKAMQSYIATTDLLIKAGMKEGVDYTFDFAKNPPSALLAVASGAADAAGGASVLLKSKEVLPVANNLRVLVSSEPLPQLSWAVGERVTSEKSATILKAMLNAPANVRTAAKVDGWKQSDDADYAKVRQMVEAVTGKAYQ